MQRESSGKLKRKRQFHTERNKEIGPPPALLPLEYNGLISDFDILSIYSDVSKLSAIEEHLNLLYRWVVSTVSEYTWSINCIPILAPLPALWNPGATINLLNWTVFCRTPATNLTNIRRFSSVTPTRRAVYGSTITGTSVARPTAITGLHWALNVLWTPWNSWDILQSFTIPSLMWLMRHSVCHFALIWIVSMWSTVKIAYITQKRIHISPTNFKIQASNLPYFPLDMCTFCCPPIQKYPKGHSSHFTPALSA